MNRAKLRALCTPDEYLPRIRDFFGRIDTDPCSNVESHVAAAREYIWPAHDGLREDWIGATYVNPPWGYDYDGDGETLRPWLERCVQLRWSADILALVPAAYGRSWWMELVLDVATSVCHVQRSCCPLVLPDGTLSGYIPVAFIYYGQRTSFAHSFRGLGPCWSRA